MKRSDMLEVVPEHILNGIENYEGSDKLSYEELREFEKCLEKLEKEKK